ncbi:MAG: hypothetical protein HYX72_10200 [Acidobacteria bacterium]|nr:hypothetical protein [Acidobacteriota bacterium]
MNTRTMLSSAALVLVGFCAAAGLNFLSIGTTVHGAASDAAQPALRTVARDATLKGDGTAALPLGIANGAVTAPKLSTAAVPSIGQVLGFNGANLAWQNAPVGGVRVADSKGQIVGPFTPNAAIMRISNLVFQIGVDESGFRAVVSTPAYHVSSDCSGPRYYADSFTPNLIRNSVTIGTQLVYGASPLQQITFSSVEHLTAPIVSNLQGSCDKVLYTSSAGVLTTFDLTTLGLTPPFHLEF